MAEEDPNTRGSGFQNRDAGTPVGDHYLFVIAIDKYNHKFNSYRDLNNPINDAVRFMDVLHRRYMFVQDDLAPKDLRTVDAGRYKDAKQHIPVYNGLKTKTLYNEEANWANIEDHFIRLFNNGSHENDSLIVFFAGHGEIDKNGNGKVVLHRKSDEDDMKVVYENFCFEKLDNYLVNKQFRHVLFVFDCCYAGSFNLGTSGNTEKETFSRYALSSCAFNQPAADEIRGMSGGSPFSYALTQILESKGGDMFNFSDIEKTLESQIDIKTSKKQSIKYAPMGVKMNGQGEFTFVLRNEVKSVWKIEKLRDSIMDNLGFDSIKGYVSDNYKPVKNKINIFSVCSKDEHIHNIVGKILFRAASRKEKNSGFDISKSEILTYEDSIWITLLRHKEPNVMEDAELDEGVKKEIVTWMVGRLLSDAQSSPSLTFVLSGPINLVTDEILIWLTEFSKIFFEQTQVLEKEESRLCKLVFLFQEKKPVINGNAFFGEEVEKKANIIITPPAKKLDLQSLKNWVFSLPPELFTFNVEMNKNDDKLCQILLEKKLLPLNFDPDVDELDHKDYTSIIFDAFQVEKEKSLEVIKNLYTW